MKTQNWEDGPKAKNVESELMPVAKFMVTIANSPNGMRMWSSQEREAYESAARGLSNAFMALDEYHDK